MLVHSQRLFELVDEDRITESADLDRANIAGRDAGADLSLIHI